MIPDPHVREPDAIVLAAMLESLPDDLGNDEATLIYALRWRGFSFGEIQTHLDAIKAARSAERAAA